MGERLVFDIEADGLLLDVTKLHCISVYNVDTGEAARYHWWDIEDGLDRLSKADLLIGHNICTYDIPAIRKLHPTWSYGGELIDTLLLGCILYPEDGVLSLEDWTAKLHMSVEKVQNEDWTTYTPLMGERCDKDVKINYKVYQHLSSHSEYPLVKGVPLDTEQKVALIHAAQTLRGVTFDAHKAIFLIKELDTRLAVLREAIIAEAPKVVLLPGVAKCRQESERKKRKSFVDRNEIPPGTCKCFKADGTYNQATKKYFGNDYRKVKGPYTKITIKSMNPDSSEEVKELLLSLGWKPTEWNSVKDKVTGEFRITSPKLTEDSYDSLPPGFGKTVAEYKMMSHRRNFLLNKTDNSKGALAAAAQRGDGRVTADAFTCGTPTSRYRHSGTVCNIPRPSTPYGPQLRSLFMAAEGFLQVGVDLSGIEARMLAHYLLAGRYNDCEKTAKLILSGDFHTVNAEMWGVSRDTAKSVLYALMYGAGAKKLAQTAGKPESMGAKLKRDFYKKHPGIAQLIRDLESAYEVRGWIKGLDGRPLYIRSKMKLLNTLLQNAAAVVFKNWMIKLEKFRGMCGIFDNVHQLIAYHDELQFEVGQSSKGTAKEEVAKEWAKTCEDMSVETGEDLGIKVKIEAEAKIGENWRDCH